MCRKRKLRLMNVSPLTLILSWGFVTLNTSARLHHDSIIISVLQFSHEINRLSQRIRRYSQIYNVGEIKTVRSGNLSITHCEECLKEWTQLICVFTIDTVYFVIQLIPGHCSISSTTILWCPVTIWKPPEHSGCLTGKYMMIDRIYMKRITGQSSTV